jgi:hypothetical protein
VLVGHVVDLHQHMHSTTYEQARMLGLLLFSMLPACNR